MSHKSNLKPLAIALGTAFVTTLATTPAANATENPFAMTNLSSGYMVADNAQGSCGGAKTKEGSCGAGKTEAGQSETTEAATQASEDQSEEGQGGAAEAAPKTKEGQCGEAKCGANK
jgi:uncharacterized low-complexity protein